jgi:hypothetical protein
VIVGLSRMVEGALDPLDARSDDHLVAAM